jgi:hypothetical protein
MIMLQYINRLARGKGHGVKGLPWAWVLCQDRENLTARDTRGCRTMVALAQVPGPVLSHETPNPQSRFDSKHEHFPGSLSVLTLSFHPTLLSFRDVPLE